VAHMDSTSRLKDAINDFLSELAQNNRSPHTLRAYETDLSQFAASYPGPVSQITASNLRAFLTQYAHSSPATLFRKYTTLAGFLKWACKRDLMDANPTDCILFEKGKLDGMKELYSITRGKVIIDFSSMYCDTPEKLLRSALFEEIVRRFVNRLKEKGTPVFKYIADSLCHNEKREISLHTVNALRLLHSHRAQEIVEIGGKYAALLEEKEFLYEFVEELYNFWRRFERYMVLTAPRSSHYTKDSIHHVQFIRANEELRQLTLSVYRAICANITGRNPRVYRQLPAGANMGMLLEQIDWDCPEEYRRLDSIPFIRLALVEPPLILYPKMNYRQGKFEEVFSNPLLEASIEESEWLCYPAKLGELVAFIYFHRDFVSLGLSLSNLFEIAEYEEILGKSPDAILVFGANPITTTENATVFYEDTKNNICLGYEVHTEIIDYFGYVKKMILTLHNLIIIRRGRLPVHGAMVHILLKDGADASVVIVGDSGAGESESLEAFRVLAEEYISQMTVIFDDMGSIEIGRQGDLLGYGTEIGAFLRLDDLQPGYAFEEIDRSIFMNPHRANARIIVPVTRHHHVIWGYPIDLFLYANNYEQVDEEHPAIQFFTDPNEALQVFNNGARLAKGTTDENGLVNTYFANPFGAPQRREEHGKLARECLRRMFEQGVKVGQLRTRLAIEGFEQEGPQSAAKDLFRVIQSLREGDD